MSHTPVLIIGAGPAGLATASRLRKLGLDFEMLEQSDQVGNAWHNHYERLHLHTVKELSHLPGLPFPENYPRFVPRHLLADYFETYAREFDISPHFGEEVISVKKRDGRWLTNTRTGKEFTSEYVVIATGVNRVPYRPLFKGEEDFNGTIVHSREYWNAEPFLGQRVLVVGMGNTGAEIALDLCENGVEVLISARGPINIVPRAILGRATQLTALKLAKLPEWIGDWIGVLVQKFTVGDLSRYGLQTPDMPPAKQLRLTGKTPVIDVGTLNQIKAGRIRVLPGIDCFYQGGVAFANGEKLEFDSIILATGYRARVEDFLEGGEEALDQFETPSFCVGEGKFEGLFFVGFDNYTPGGLLGVINRDSKVVAEILKESLGV
jgi:cation diffusion facilitator CzcD-associated flavoprotein CzcO